MVLNIYRVIQKFKILKKNKIFNIQNSDRYSINFWFRTFFYMIKCVFQYSIGTLM